MVAAGDLNEETKRNQARLGGEERKRQFEIWGGDMLFLGELRTWRASHLSLSSPNNHGGSLP